MARTGRPPKPIPLRVLEGNRGKRKVPSPHELDRRPGDPPEVPEGMSEGQRVLWQAAVDEVGVVLKPADREVLRVFVVAADSFQRASKIVTEAGVLIRGVRTEREVVRNPASAEARLWAKLVLQAGAELGMTPAARARLAAGGASSGEGDSGAWLLNS